MVFVQCSSKIQESAQLDFSQLFIHTYDIFTGTDYYWDIRFDRVFIYLMILGENLMKVIFIAKLEIILLKNVVMHSMPLTLP